MLALFSQPEWGHDPTREEKADLVQITKDQRIINLMEISLNIYLLGKRN